MKRFIIKKTIAGLTLGAIGYAVAKRNTIEFNFSIKKREG